MINYLSSSIIIKLSIIIVPASKWPNYKDFLNFKSPMNSTSLLSSFLPKSTLSIIHNFKHYSITIKSHPISNINSTIILSINSTFIHSPLDKSNSTTDTLIIPKQSNLVINSTNYISIIKDYYYLLSNQANPIITSLSTITSLSNLKISMNFSSLFH